MNFSKDDLDGAISHYEKHGYAKIENVCDARTLENLRARADDLMLGRVRYPGMFFQHDTDSGKYEDLEYGKGYEGASLNYRKIEKLELDPLYLAWIENPLFEKIARKVIEDDVVIYRALMFAKAANGGSNLPWHQDGGKFWGLDRDPKLQIWTALDDVPIDSGCVEVFPDSHRLGLVTPLGGVVPDKHLLERTPEIHALPIPARAGDVMLIHNHLWHRSGLNKTASPRRAFTVCFMSAQTKCLRKKRAPRVFFPVFRRTSS
jgi:ectoine hydroxylase-related dioxygenase (phytanoyl-CoA dioxygenase family)